MTMRTSLLQPLLKSVLHFRLEIKMVNQLNFFNNQLWETQDLSGSILALRIPTSVKPLVPGDVLVERFINHIKGPLMCLYSRSLHKSQSKKAAVQVLA